MRWTQVSCLFTALSFSLITSPLHANQRSSFEDAEHVAAGDQVELYFNANAPAENNYHFTLDNGLIVSYGDILSLGDFYEIPLKPISAEKTLEEKKARFIEAFNSLSQPAATVPEANSVLGVMHQEYQLVQDGIAQGETPEEVYKRIGDNDNRQYNCLTGGGCGNAWWLIPGRYLILASMDEDHFGAEALDAYRAGHAVAMEVAVAAKEKNDPALLTRAYAMNAFASHFLSDRYSAGHMRTPRAPLLTTVSPGVIGSLLAKFMHNEENSVGLDVHNQQGAHWRALGDKQYFSKDNAENRLQLKLALQSSADEIFAAYQSGQLSDANAFLSLLPVPNEQGMNADKDISPLFYWDDKTNVLLRREDTANVHDKHWTASWWGWSTFVRLSQERGIPTDAQQELARSGLGEKALEAGLLTDPDVVRYVKRLSDLPPA